MRSLVNWQELLSLEKQYVFYKRDHSHPTNVLLHVVCDPLLHIPYLATLSQVPLPWPVCDVARAVALAYTAYNLAVGGALGALIAPTTAAYYMLACALRDALGVSRLLLVTAVAHKVVWETLFYAHRVFQGGLPSLSRSFVQAWAAEPILIWLEVMWFFGLLHGTRERLRRAYDRAQVEHSSE